MNNVQYIIYTALKYIVILVKWYRYALPFHLTMSLWIDIYLYVRACAWCTLYNGTCLSLYSDPGRWSADCEPGRLDAATQPQHGELGGQPLRQQAGQQVINRLVSRSSIAWFVGHQLPS